MVSEYEEMKDQKVCIIWSLLILLSISYDKICMVTKMTIFSIIRSCSTSRCIISTQLDQSMLTRHKCLGKKWVMDFDVIVTSHFQ